MVDGNLIDAARGNGRRITVTSWWAEPNFLADPALT